MKLTQFISNISLAETRTKALTSAAKTAGGAGGLLALYDGANRSNEALGALESVAGGAAAGFSMGGPWGALVGGAGGGLIAVLHDLSKKTDDISGSMYAGKRDVQDYASSLDEVTGAASTATAKLVLLDLQQHGLLSIGDKLGLSSRDLVGYVLGNAHAHDRVTAALKQANSVAGQVVTTFDQYGNVVQIGTQENRDLLQAAGQLTTGLGITRRGLTATERATRDAAMAGENMASVYKAFPKKVATEIDAVGIVPTAKGVADLATKYDAVDNRHLKALIQATGTDLTVKQVQAVIAHMQYLQSHNSVTVTTHYVSVGSHGDAGTPDAHGGGQRGGQRMSEKASMYERLLRDSGGGPDGAKKRGELTHAGVQLLESLVKGIDSGKHKLDNILSAVDKNLQNKVQHYNDVLAQYQAIQGGFAGVTSNIFSTTGADGGAATLSDILTASAGNVYSSQQLQQDVLKLLGEGLSKSLLLQLQQSGPSGLSDIHTLASQASVSQIQQLNANDVASSSALTAAGTAIANQLEGHDLKQAAKLEKIARALEEAVKKLDDVGGKFEFVLQGDTLVAVLAKHKKHHPDA